jgi:hypothetical protein
MIAGLDYVLCETFNPMHLFSNIAGKSFLLMSASIAWQRCMPDKIIITFSILMRRPFSTRDEKVVKQDSQIIAVRL